MQTKLIIGVLIFGFVLASIGQLQKLTHAMGTFALDAQKHEIVSLGKWNRALNSPSKRH